MAICIQSNQEYRHSKLFSIWRGIRRNTLTVIGFFIVTLFLLMAIFGPLFVPYDYAEQNIEKRLQPPSAEHIFGTDEFGRDVFSRVVVGSRNVFIVAGSGAALAVLLGLFLGLVSGYWGGLLDDVLMRLMEVMMAIPGLLLAMLVLFSLGSSFYSVILVVGFMYIPVVTRVVRSVVLDIKTRAFVEAAKLRGESIGYILFREILPNVLPHLAVEGSMRFVYAIFMVASLGFLGLGVQPPAPDWGFMVSEARPFFSVAPWVLFFPAASIAILVVGVSFVSDGLRRILLPGGVSSDRYA
ncbi:MAG: ABC transporter permease [Thermacetogeniaceae bacterium]|jgi:peptide/nickel transport system permease protein|nr:ABC transporter permease [Syntrophomonadaceae bacterium]